MSDTIAAPDFPRAEAARLCSAALRPSRFLIVTRRDDPALASVDEIRVYGIDYPDSVPAVAGLDPHMQDLLCADLRRILPLGGVICVPPPDHLLCQICRIGTRTHITSSGGHSFEICDSCAIAIQQSRGDASVKPIVRPDAGTETSSEGR